MGNDFNLNSKKWLNLIFEGKNKEYGAYVHRDESPARHLKALIIITVVSLSVIFLPSLIKSVIPAAKDDTQSEELKTTVINIEDQLPEENQIKEIVMPPPPEIKASIQYVAPKIVEDDKIKDDELMLTQAEILESKAEVSIQTVEGSLDSGVNIADITEHKVVIEEKAEVQIYTHVEVMPEFPGGEAELMKWLKDNIIYPTIAQEQGIQGRVMLRFVVRPDGSIDDVNVYKSLDPSCDKEALRAVKKMPKWTPGKQNGNPVSVYYNLPVVFRLQNAN